MVAETFVELLKSGSHWEFELFLMVLFDGLLLGFCYPLFKRWLADHDAKKHAHEHCDDIHPKKPTLEELMANVVTAQAASEEALRHLQEVMGRMK